MNIFQNNLCKIRCLVTRPDGFVQASCNVPIYEIYIMFIFLIFLKYVDFAK